MNTKTKVTARPEVPYGVLRSERVVLIVDDNPTNLKVIADYLESCGLRPLVSRDGEMALERARVARPDLILLDVMMPGIDGFETCRRLKADAETRDIPVIFMTVLEDTESKIRGFEVGAVDYIAKPLQQEEVLARVVTHLHIRELTQNLKARNAQLQQELAERRRAEEALQAQTARLEEAVNELETFSYSVSHDLQAPLRAISGFSEILREDYADRLDAEGLRVMGVICDSVERTRQLIGGLLTFSRLGRQTMHRVDIDMTTLAREVLAELSALAPDRDVRFTVETLPPAHGDRAMLRQVWTNLLSNAIKFTRGRSPAVIAVGGAREGDDTVYWVRDNGLGFDMAYAHRLYAVFQRLHSDQEFEGTGVGLALVQRIVRRHGGQVWAEGEVDKGATFYFTLSGERGGRSSESGLGLRMRDEEREQ